MNSLEEKRKKIVSKMYPKWQFENLCRDNGWKYHMTGMHETHINSNKLSPSEKFQPSYIVDQGFGDLGLPLTWVEVKSCSKTGLVRVQKKEWELHKRFNEARRVFYAIYKPTENTFHNIIAIDELEGIAAEEAGNDNFLVFHVSQIDEM